MSIIGTVESVVSPNPLSKVKLALKIAPFVLLAILLGIVLWQRNSLTDKSAKLEAASGAVSRLEATNAANQKTINDFAQQRVDNDAIAEAVASRIDVNRAATQAVNNKLKDAYRNDPNVRTWADMPIPDSVRRAINPPG